MKKIKFNSLLFLINTVMIISSLFGCKSVDKPFKSLSVSEFEQSLNATDVICLDVRSNEEYAAGHIPGAINIDVLQPDFESNCIKRLSKDHTIAVYCRSGKRSKKAAQILSKQHFQVIELNDGFLGWTQDSKPVSLE